MILFVIFCHPPVSSRYKSLPDSLAGPRNAWLTQLRFVASNTGNIPST